MHADVKKNEGSFKNIFYIFLKLGLTSFGGPAAHIAFFREEFVSRRNWLNDQAYAELVALCHFLPGPASSQVGFAIGLARGGKPGALAAWLGFTLPSAVVLMAFALGLNTFAYSELKNPQQAEYFAKQALQIFNTSGMQQTSSYRDCENILKNLGAQ